jgi:cell division septation protein DedD
MRKTDTGGQKDKPRLIKRRTDDIWEKRNHTLKHLNQILFVLFLTAVGLAFFGAGLLGGQKIFAAYKAAVKDALQVDASPAPEAAGSAALAVKPEIAVPKVKTNAVDSAVEPKADAARSAAAAVMAEIPMPNVKAEVTAPAVEPKREGQQQVTKKAAVQKAPVKRKEYKVIVGSFSAKANADSLIGQLIRHEYEPSIVYAKTPEGPLYRVIAGSYRSLREAKARMGGLEELGFQSFTIAE